MASQKQLAANRQNARRSTGPRTAAGKARSSANAYRHGLTAESIVIGDEDPAEFRRLCAALEQEHAPQSSTEAELVARLAGLFWRINRVPRLEAAVIEARAAEAVGPDLTEEDPLREHLKEFAEHFRIIVPAEESEARRLRQRDDKEANEARLRERAAEHRRRRANIGLALIRDGEQHDVISKLARYETGLMNSISRTLGLLHALKTSRMAVEGNRRAIDTD